MNDLARDPTLYTVLLVALGVLAGCGGDAETPIPTAPAPPPPEPAPPPPEPTPEPPATPTGLIVSGATETSITWTWNAVEGATGYVVQANTDEMWDDTDTVIFTVGGAMVPFTTETTYTASDLKAGTTMYVRVAAAAVDAPLVSAFSTHVTGMAPLPESAPPPPEPDTTHCPGGYGEVQNLRLVESGSDFVTYAWDDDPCVEVYDFWLRKVYDYRSEDGRTHEAFGGGETRRVSESRATFTDLTDGVYGPEVHLNGSENPFDYVLFHKLDRPYFDRSIRYERWEDSPVVCTGEMENEARRSGSELLREWDRERKPFVVNVRVSLDNAPAFDADWVLAEAEEAADRFREVLGIRVLEIGNITSRSERRPGEILIDYGPYPDRSQPWADDVLAFASVGGGRVTLTGATEFAGHGGFDEYDVNRRAMDMTLIHEVFHLFGFIHHYFELGISVANPIGPGVDMTPEMTIGSSVDTLQDFAALRCVLGL